MSSRTLPASYTAPDLGRDAELLQAALLAPAEPSAFDCALPYVYAACAVGAVVALVFNHFRF